MVRTAWIGMMSVPPSHEEKRAARHYSGLSPSFLLSEPRKHCRHFRLAVGSRLAVKSKIGNWSRPVAGPAKVRYQPAGPSWKPSETTHAAGPCLNSALRNAKQNQPGP